MNPEYVQLAQLAYDTVLAVMAANEGRHEPGEWKTQTLYEHVSHGINHLEAPMAWPLLSTSAMQEELSNALTRGAMALQVYQAGAGRSRTVSDVEARWEDTEECNGSMGPGHYSCTPFYREADGAKHVVTASDLNALQAQADLAAGLRAALVLIRDDGDDGISYGAMIEKYGEERVGELYEIGVYGIANQAINPQPHHEPFPPKYGYRGETPDAPSQAEWEGKSDEWGQPHHEETK